MEINKIYNEDCLIGMQRIADKSVDCVICDPPFGTTANKWDSVIPFDKMWEQLNRIVKPKGNIILFGCGLFGMKLVLSNERKYRYELIWKKSKCGSPLSAKHMPLKKHENIYVFGDSASYYEPQMSVGTPYKRKFTPNNVNNMRYGINGVYTDNKGTRHPITILDFPQKWRRQDQLHPTQKPVELIEFLVKSYCPIDGVVLDFCMGSGTTAIACLNTNRKFIGFELDKGYYDIAVKRVNECKKQNNYEKRN